MTKFNKPLLSVSIALCALLGAQAETVTLHTPEGFQILSLSPNGKWGCGVYIDAMMDTYGFRWNLESGSIEMLGSHPSLAYDVANDGTVSGEFPDALATDNGVEVTMPGYWRDGRWHHLQMPQGAVAEGIGYGISPDGQYMTGAVMINGYYTAMMWKNGDVHRVLGSGTHSVGFAVSPDGSSATGFNTLYNRTACYWAPDGTVTHFLDSPEYSQGPWNYGRNFSPDGSKLLYWGGWVVEGEEHLSLYSIYDVNTGERTMVPAPSMESDLEFHDISNNGLLVGGNLRRGYVWNGEQGMVVDDYLASRGIDLSKFEDFYTGTDYYQGQLPINNIVALSEDENIFAMTYYNTRGQVSSLVLKADQDLSTVAPVEIKANQLEGLQTVALTWARPVGANSIRGFNIYRDGTKINGFLPINVPYYYDRNLKAGTYRYQVSAVNLAGVETRAEEVTVTVSDNGKVVQPPLSSFARQKGINSAHISWLAPLSNRVHKRYYDPETSEISGFGVYEAVEVEAAIRFDKNEMSNYNGYQISEVSFLPMAEHTGWKVNIYTRNDAGELSLVASQPITQTLKIKEINTIKLNTPVPVPAGELIVAIGVMGDPSNYQVIGAQLGEVKVGYSDLLRQTSEPDFYSTYDRSAESGMTLSYMSWSIDVSLEPNGYSEDANVLDHYNVYIDGEKAAETNDLVYVADALKDGEHKAAIEAVYANGLISQLEETSFTIKAKYPKIEAVDLDLGEQGSTVVTASWQTPTECDLTSISYTKASTPAGGIKGVSDNGFALMAASEYPATMLRSYEGYKVKSFRFYPLADALFTFMLYENNRLAYELEVDEFTIGQWNEIELPDDYYIKPNVTYQLVIDCFDPEPDVHVLAVDNDYPREYVSDLYSIDNGEEWNALSIETGMRGNWMMGMVITTPEEQEIPINGYDMIVDNLRVNDSPITTTQYAYDLGTHDNKRHAMRIDIYYPARMDVVRGTTTFFYLNPAGVSDAMIATVKLQRGDNYLVAEGDGITALTLISIDGAEIAHASGDRLDISGVQSGIYVVQIQMGDNAISRKVSILK